MAELLIKAIDANHTDPVKDQRGCYKHGDPVLVMPDGHTWGRCEGFPLFWRVRVPVEHWSLDEYCVEHVGQQLYAYREPRLLHRMLRRRWHFTPRGLALTERKALLANRIVTVTWKEFKACMGEKSVDTVLRARDAVRMAA